jgi:hypothetical protein
MADPRDLETEDRGLPKNYRVVARPFGKLKGSIQSLKLGAGRALTTPELALTLGQATVEEIRYGDLKGGG